MKGFKAKGVRRQRQLVPVDIRPDPQVDLDLRRHGQHGPRVLAREEAGGGVGALVLQNQKKCRRLSRQHQRIDNVVIASARARWQQHQ